MKKIRFLSSAVLTALVVALFQMSSCNESIGIGSEILPDDDVLIEHTDFIGLKASVIVNDSVIVYSSTSPLANYVLGELEDPSFGKTKSDLVCMPRLPFSAGVYLRPDTQGNSLDSAIIILPVNSTNMYGDTTASHKITVHKVLDNLRERITFSNYEEIAYDPEIIGELDGYVYNPDSILLYNPVSDTTILERAHIRIPLNHDFASQLVTNGSIYFNTDTSFLNFLPGLYIRSETENSSILSLDFGTLNQPRMRVYYTESDTARIFDYVMNGAYIDPQPRFNVLETDYTNTPVEQAILDTAKTSDFIYLRGMADGFQTILDFTPIIDEYRDVALNRAELLITLIDEGQDSILFPPIDELTLEYINDDGFSIPVSEASSIISSNNDRLIDGSISNVEQEDGVETKTYKLILTNTIQQIISGTLPAQLYLKSRFQINDPRRSVMLGTDSDLYPITISVSYSVSN